VQIFSIFSKSTHHPFNFARPPKKFQGEAGLGVGKRFRNPALYAFSKTT